MGPKRTRDYSEVNAKKVRSPADKYEYRQVVLHAERLNAPDLFRLSKWLSEHMATRHVCAGCGTVYAERCECWPVRDATDCIRGTP